MLFAKTEDLFHQILNCHQHRSNKRRRAVVLKPNHIEIGAQLKLRHCLLVFSALDRKRAARQTFTFQLENLVLLFVYGFVRNVPTGGVKRAVYRRPTVAFVCF